MRSQRSQIQERAAGVARSESQLVLPLLETGSESTAQQPQEQQQQQQFKTEEHWMVVVTCRDKVELETRGGEQEELLQLPLKQQQQLQPPAPPPLVWTSKLVIPLLRLGARALYSSSRRGSSSSSRRGRDGSKIWL